MEQRPTPWWPTGPERCAAWGGPGNWEDVGLVEALNTLQQAITEALAQADASPSEVTAAAYGLAGLDWLSDEERLRPLVAQLGVAGRKSWLTTVWWRSGSGHEIPGGW